MDFLSKDFICYYKYVQRTKRKIRMSYKIGNIKRQKLNFFQKANTNFRGEKYNTEIKNLVLWLNS